MTDTQNIDPVINFIKQAVVKKHGDQDSNFVNQETQRVYNDFGNNLLEHFSSLLSKEQSTELESLIKKTKSQKVVLGYLMESIDNFEQKIIEYLMGYVENYLAK